MNSICAAFAKGDFSSLAPRFVNAGFLVQQPCEGVIQIHAAKFNPKRGRLVISAGVHGDETAPIELVALILEELSKTPELLAVDLMIVIGNLHAIAESRRFIDVDLNRLFTHNRTSFNQTKEALRADQLMHATAQFFNEHKLNYHLDLHTAIRASLYPTFAVVPGKYNSGFVRWLSTAGIAAVVLSPQPSTTFSSYTCVQFGAVSCTAELGRIGALGKNDLSQFSTIQRAIADLLRSGKIQHSESMPVIFSVTQELVKHSDEFQFTFDKNTKNFTEFSPNTLLATDGVVTYSVGSKPEFVLFPNPDVRIGLRAGLMISRSV